MSEYDRYSYPYLEAEDRAFAQCFRLSETEFLRMMGGLKTYTEHRLNREKARGASIEAGGQTKIFSVPTLPFNIESAMAQIKVEGLSETDWAKYLLGEQVKTVGGIMSALKADKEMKAWQARQEADKQASKERELQQLRDTASNRYGWKSDSQSAKDWAEGEYVRRHRGA